MSPHIDDAEFGAGGTIVRHIDQDDEIKWHTFISKEYRVPEGWKQDSLSQEFCNAMAVFGIDDYKLHDFEVDTLDRIKPLRDLIYKIWHSYNPDIVYVPWAGSRHQDHKAVGECCLQVSWKSDADVRAYFLLNDFIGCKPTIFSPLSDHEHGRKMQVLKCYKSQYRLRKWFSDELIFSFMRTWGAFAHDGSTEIFEQVRRLI